MGPHVMYSILGASYAFVLYNVSLVCLLTIFSSRGYLSIIPKFFFLFLLSSTSTHKIYVTTHNYYSSSGSVSLKTPCYKVSIIQSKESTSFNSPLY